MLLRPGAVEMGGRRSELRRFTYDAGEMILASRHVETWARTDSVHYLSLAISDAALTAACDGIAREIELRGTPKLVDGRVGALVAAVNAERIAGFPSGRLFLDSVEQALAVALISGHGVRDRSVRVYRGGLGAARLRRVTDLVHAEIEDELSLGAGSGDTAKLPHYTPEFVKRWQRYSRSVGGSWRCDETYIKVRGNWMYLYRAVDKAGKTVDFYLSPKRDVAAAKPFCAKPCARSGGRRRSRWTPMPPLTGP